MPLWTIHHPVDAYSAQDKREFATAITGMYTSIGLPAFYAVTVFNPVHRESFLVGGEARDDSVRIAVEHIAVHTQDPSQQRRVSESISRLIAPFTIDRGLHSEFHVDETPRDLWMIDGVWPPPFGSAGERVWVEQNRPVPY